MEKQCRKCNVVKPLNEFYKHAKMLDGHLNVCKTCYKKQTNEHEKKLRKDPNKRPALLERDRENYHRNKHNYKSTSSKATQQKYVAKYPEKDAAKCKTSGIKPLIKGNHLHHWSYNKQHYKDVIELEPSEHYLLHRFMVYDSERFMYRRISDMLLLDTKESHLELLNEIKSNDKNRK